MSGLRILKPIPVTDAILTSSDVPETDYAAIANSHAYTAGDRVKDTASGVHGIYQAVAGFTSASPAIAPHLDADNWLRVSPTNRWKLLDTSNSSRTTQTTSMSYQLTFGKSISAVYALDMVGVKSVRVRLIDATYGTVYDQTVTTGGLPASSSWWAWYFGVRSLNKTFAAFPDIPAYPNGVLHVDFTGTSELAVGSLVAGQMTDWGLGVQAGAKVGIQDYSRKETNDFGDIDLVERAFASRAEFQFPIENTRIDALRDFLASIRATPCVYIGGDRAITTVFGIYKDFDILINYSRHSDVQINLLGLT